MTPLRSLSSARTRLSARPALLACALLLAVAPGAVAWAQSSSPPIPPGEPGRFTLQPVQGGLLRLDTRTGAMSFCAARGGSGQNWQCEPVPDDRAALEAEIARLRDRLARLEAPGGVPDIAAPPLPAPPAGKDAPAGRDAPARKDAPPAAPEDGPTTAESAEAALDRAMEMAERAFNRLRAMAERLHRDFSQQSPDPAQPGPPPPGPLPKGEPM